jgi:hypothetical protein
MIPPSTPPAGPGRRPASWAIPLLVLSACAPALHPPPAVVETDPSVLLARCDAWTAGLQSLSAEGRAEGRTDRGALKGRVTLLALRSGRLRVDAWTPTDLWVASLVAGPDHLVFLQRGEACLVGDPCPRNLGLLLPPGWDLAAAAAALMGVPPRDEAAGPWQMDYDRRLGAWRLESGLAGGGRQRLWIRPDGAPLRHEVERPGRPLRRMDAEAGDGPGTPPRSVRLQSGDQWVSVRYREAEANPVPEDADWEVQCPEDRGLRVLRCEEGTP